MRLVLDVTPALGYAQALTQAPDIAQDEMTGALLEALLLLEREVKDAAPVGVTEALRGSIASELRGSSLGDFEAAVFSPLVYAAPVELGTKPHWPPLAPLMDWVRVKFTVFDVERGVEAERLPDSTVEGIARHIQRLIGTRGTKGQGFFAGALERTEGQINDILGRGIGRINDRLQGLSDPTHT